MIVALLLSGAATAQDAWLGSADFPLGVAIEACPLAEADCREAVESAFAAWEDECLAFEVFDAGPVLDGVPPADAALVVRFTSTVEPGLVLVTDDGSTLGIELSAAATFATDAAVAVQCVDAYSLTAAVQEGVGSLLGVPTRNVELCETAWVPDAAERGLLGESLASQAEFSCVPNIGAEVVGGVPLDVVCTLSDPDSFGSDLDWRFGDGATATGPVVEHTFTEGGNFTVSVGFGDDPEVCAIAGARTSRLGYVRACERPDVAFELFHNGGLTYVMRNKTDVSVYGCLYDIEWSLYEGGNTKGRPLEGPVKAWEPTFEIPEEGQYTVLAQATGVAGKGAAEMTFDAQRGVGDGLQQVTCATACDSTGGTSGWPALAVTLLMLFRRRE